MARILLSLLLLTACGTDDAASSDTGLDGSDTDATDDDTNDDTGYGSDAVTFAADIAPLTGVACASCHTADASGGFSGADTHSGWMAQSSTGLAYCEPGSLDDSYGYLKIVGNQATAGGAGAQMPTNGSLSAAEIGLVEAWILDGCQP